MDTVGIYFFNTQMGKGVVDERHPQYLGTAALSSNDFLHKALEKADLIINVGHDVIEKPPFFKTWRPLYWLVLGNLALMIAVFYFITQYFS